MTNVWRTTTHMRIARPYRPRGRSLRQLAKRLRVAYVDTSEGDDRRSRDVGHLPNALQSLGRHGAIQ
jgi:hypothetical protein